MDKTREGTKNQTILSGSPHETQGQPPTESENNRIGEGACLEGKHMARPITSWAKNLSRSVGGGLDGLENRLFHKKSLKRYRFDNTSTPTRIRLSLAASLCNKQKQNKPP